MSPARYTQPHHAVGSITQGLPPHSSSTQLPRQSAGGSISMGTPHFESNLQQQGVPSSAQGGKLEGGSITQGTPLGKGYEHPHHSSSRGGPPPLTKEHKTYDTARDNFEQMFRQLSPNATVAMPSSTASGYSNVYSNPTEVQRSTLIGDYITAKQMKDDRRTVTTGEHDNKQHSPRGSSVDTRMPFQYVLEPRHPQAAAYLQKHQAALLHPNMQPTGDRQRVSPLPPPPSHNLSTHAQLERESISTLKNAFEMRDMMQSQQQQHKAGLQQHSPSVKQPQHHTRDRSPPPGMPLHHGVIKEVPHREDARTQRSIVMGSSGGSAGDQRPSLHHLPPKDVHSHQSEEQAQFVNRNRPDSEPAESQVRKQIRNIQRATKAMPMDPRMRPQRDMPGYGSSSHGEASLPHQQQPSRSNSDPASTNRSSEGHQQQQHRSTPGSASSAVGNAYMEQRHAMEPSASNSNNSSNSSGENGKAAGMKTLTAASLIDIIITNQINSNVNKKKPSGNILGRLEDTNSPEQRGETGGRDSPQHLQQQHGVGSRPQGGITIGAPHNLLQGRLKYCVFLMLSNSFERKLHIRPHLISIQ